MSGDIVVFDILGKVFYLDQYLRLLYNENGTRMVGISIDNWLQAETGQRVSYRGLCDMAVAFVDGMRFGYSATDVEQLIAKTTRESRKSIFESPLCVEYSQRYFIEVSDPIKLDTWFANGIGKYFDDLLAKLGVDKFYSHLCRCWQACNYHRKSVVHVFERFIRKLGRVPAHPQYPNVDDLDSALVAKVMCSVLKDKQIISHEVLQNVENIRSERLSRTS